MQTIQPQQVTQPGQKWTPADWSYFIKRTAAAAADVKVNFFRLVELGEQEYAYGAIEAANRVKARLIRMARPQ